MSIGIEWLVGLALIIGIGFFGIVKGLWPLLVRKAFAFVRKTLPPMSETERAALEAGDVWWEGELFRGRPQWSKLLALPVPKLSAEEQAFLDNQVEVLCAMLDDWHITHERLDLPDAVWAYLKKERFFGLVISKQYDGLGFSALAHSTIIAKIATRSVSAAVNAMVPNSLGPAELLFHYGTEEQKNYYLPRLARGEEVPCFALTGPDAGSDAASMHDTGMVCKGQYQGQEVLGIRLNWDKRYITLAPIATVLGLAFKLYDPDHLLGEQEDLGITVCLIPTQHPGVHIGNRHFPLNMAFLNGPTRGENVFVPLTWVIGGASQVGQGWRMLMECLSIGRGISLPAMATALAKMCYRTTGAYAMLRRQFKLPIAYFEGVEEALARIGSYTYLLEATRLLTVGAIDQQVKPAIVSAIAKYHMTEFARKIINDAMDIHGGRGIQLGPRNYLARAYEVVPVSITVEGANILTRSLIIFGQGALRCHPFLQQEMQAVAAGESKQSLAQFGHALRRHIIYAANNFISTIVLSLTNGRFAARSTPPALRVYCRQLTRMSSALALVADVALLVLGGKLKRKERLSARLGDVLSYLYLASATLKYYHDNHYQAEDNAYVAFIVQTCLYQSQGAFSEFFANFPRRGLARWLRFWVFPYGQVYAPPRDALGKQVVLPMLAPSALRARLTRHCYSGMQPQDAVGAIEQAFLQMVAAKKAEDKFHAALTQLNLPHYATFAQQVDEAMRLGLLSAAEATLLQEFEVAREAVMQVDEFNADYLKGTSNVRT